MAGHILLVDDDAGIRDVVASILVRVGYSVALAANEAQTIAEFERRAPDIVILDVMLGQENGWEVLRRLREKHRVPVLMSTGGSVDDEVRAQARSLGAQDVIEKPFTREELHAVIERLLARS